MKPDFLDVQLIDPTVELQKSHEKFVREFKDRGEKLVPWVVGESEDFDHFSEYVSMLIDASNGIGIPEDWVAHSTFWLIDSEDEIVAISNFRHELNEFLLKHGGHIGYGVRPSSRRRGYATELLRLTLMKAEARGINRVRVTCSPDNPASAKTILRNGGQFDEEEFMPEHGEVISRYWIELLGV